MDIVLHEAPFDAGEVLRLWSDVFGPDEAAFEAPQLDGSEAEDNLDLVLTARESGTLLGAIHATIPVCAPVLAGLSGMAVAPDARGRGLGRRLFSGILEEIDRRGVRAAYLGTGNPVAAKLYRSLGFAFLPGSNVMARYAEGDTIDFERAAFGKAQGDFAVEEGSAAMRIPLIPLTLRRGEQIVLDQNTGFANSAEMTQISCMGLYSAYQKLAARGGRFWGARDGRGVLGAVMSAAPEPEGPVADFFCCESFAGAVPLLMERCWSAVGRCRLRLAEADTAKTALAESMGFREAASSPIRLRRFSVPGRILEMRD